MCPPQIIPSMHLLHERIQIFELKNYWSTLALTENDIVQFVLMENPDPNGCNYTNWKPRPKVRTLPPCEISLAPTSYAPHRTRRTEADDFSCLNCLLNNSFHILHRITSLNLNSLRIWTAWTASHWQLISPKLVFASVEDRAWPGLEIGDEHAAVPHRAL